MSEARIYVCTNPLCELGTVGVPGQFSASHGEQTGLCPICNCEADRLFIPPDGPLDYEDYMERYRLEMIQRLEEGRELPR